MRQVTCALVQVLTVLWLKHLAKTDKYIAL